MTVSDLLCKMAVRNCRPLLFKYVPNNNNKNLVSTISTDHSMLVILVIENYMNYWVLKIKNCRC